MTTSSSDYTPLLQILDELRMSFDAGAHVAALAMIYVGLDTMALLACPIGARTQTKHDFIAWVDKYMRADPASEYQYEGVDLYAARCAVLHSYGSISDAHAKGNPPRIFGYLDNGPHRHMKAERFVLISIATLRLDFATAMQAFLTEAETNADLKARIDSRLSSLFLSQFRGH